HGEGGGVAAEPGHQSGDGNESHPVAGGGHGHGGHELRERWMPKEVSESGGLGSAGGGYLARDRRHRPRPPPSSTTGPSSTRRTSGRPHSGQSSPVGSGSGLVSPSRFLVYRHSG